MANPARNPLEIHPADLSIGSRSIGLPPSRTSEQIIQAYLELVSQLRQDRGYQFRSDDIEVLAQETRLDRSFIEKRVRSHLSA